MPDPPEQIERIRRRLAALDAERCRLERELRDLEARPAVPPPAGQREPAFSADVKIKIFRGLFRGREDVFPVRWENAKSGKSGYAIACGNEWLRGICGKPRVKCSECEHKAFLPVSDEMIRFHLSGKDARGRPFCAGVYPMLASETCRFLAVDFDKATWMSDVRAFVGTCGELSIPAYVERSRSGNGAHVWIFFAEPVPAADARMMGTHLVTRTMESYPELGFGSYDRLFPSQNTLPKGGLGNLIALPLQYVPRQSGNSVFVDGTFRPYPDQWAHLASVERVSIGRLAGLISEIPKGGSVIELPFPEDEDAEHAPWTLPPSRKSEPPALSGVTLPKRISVVLSDQIYIGKDGLAPKLRNELLRLAAFQNPEFYRAQAMRLPTFGKPRVIACAEDYPGHIALPRGVLGKLHDLAGELGIAVEVDDQRYAGNGIAAAFRGTLTAEQERAAEALLAKDTGVLSATTGFGKTVVAAAVMARRGVNTLILVHRRQLLDQWIARLAAFLDTRNISIGHLGAGKRKLSGHVDIALVQSLEHFRV